MEYEHCEQVSDFIFTATWVIDPVNLFHICCLWGLRLFQGPTTFITIFVTVPCKNNQSITRSTIIVLFFHLFLVLDAESIRSDVVGKLYYQRSEVAYLIPDTRKSSNAYLIDLTRI